MKPSQRLIAQRVRNRVIEYLGTVSSFERQREYAARVPFVQIPGELICGWEDWIPEEPVNYPFLGLVFDQHEIDALQRFHEVWSRTAEELPELMPSIEEVQKLPVWSVLRETADEVLFVLMVRGRMSEDVEQLEVE